jgi:hypothetical protein
VLLWGGGKILAAVIGYQVVVSNLNLVALALIWLVIQVPLAAISFWPASAGQRFLERRLDEASRQPDQPLADEMQEHGSRSRCSSSSPYGGCDKTARSTQERPIRTKVSRNW